MADKEQLRILDLGVKQWNEWRKDNPDVTIDFCDARLATAKLGGINLSKANLSNIDLIEADLKGANFFEANLQKANLEKANLITADLTKANLAMATLVEADLNGASLSHANLTFANLDIAKLIGANLILADLDTATLMGAHLVSAELIGANLSSSDLNKADLEGAYLSNADLTEANLIGANLTGAFLQHAILKNAVCTLASFAYSNLSLADISGAHIDSINTSLWNIKGIKCTHVFRDNKRIDYVEGEFEKAFTQVHKIIEFVINTPFSDLTYYIGKIIQELSNKKYGEGSLVLKGQTALSNNDTKLEFISFEEDDRLKSIENAVLEIRDMINPIFEEHAEKQNDMDILKIPERFNLQFVPIEIDTTALQNVFLNKFVKIDPILQKVVFAIQAIFQ